MLLGSGGVGEQELTLAQDLGLSIFKSASVAKISQLLRGTGDSITVQYLLSHQGQEQMLSSTGKLGLYRSACQLVGQPSA